MSSTPTTFPLNEYRALRSGYGFVELVGWSSVTLTGADRQSFLNNFSTNDVKRLEPGEHCEVFITNVKGKTLGHGLVSCRESELVYITVPGQAAAIIGHLDHYLIREDVTLRDSTSERTYLLIAGGEEAGRELSDACWIRWRLLSVPVCGLHEATPTDLSNLKQQAAAAGAVECGDTAFQALRIESGTPLFSVDFNDENFPQEVGRDELAISFTKGCYLGQETVARIDALGHVNQRLTGVRFGESAVPEQGTKLIHETNTAGQVTSACYSPQLDTPLAIAMVRREWQAPGSQLSWANGDCVVVELPLPTSQLRDNS